ncbi:MAG: ATP-binding protein [Luteolibacter sp.]|jgi:signal transduction histidine kinase|nr:ATP-binding protein [Luteolibacter sp.]
MNGLLAAASSGPPHRLKMEHELESALCLQRLLAEISSRFVTRPVGQVDDTIVELQRHICEALDLDRATLWQSTGDGGGMALTHFWQKTGCVPLRRNYLAEDNLPWANGMLVRGESFHFSSLDDYPPEAACDVEVLRQHGTRSNATYPLIADGEVFGALSFASISVERHWTEEEIASLKLVAEIFGHVICRHRAEQRVEQMRAEIQRSARASVLGEIAAALAHEINQPLTAILSNAQAARRFISQGEAGSAEIHAILDDIIRDDKRASEVILSLRAMLTDSPMPHEPHSLNELVSEVGAFLGKEMAGAGIELKLDLHPSLPEVRVARVEIQQLLHNLILNATHAMRDMPPGRRRILIHTDIRGSSVKVRVRDQGCGISPEHMDRIFEPFHTTRPDGLGMGLAICRRIAEAHGASLVAHNAESAGAEFVFSLPLHEGYEADRKKPGVST